MKKQDWSLGNWCAYAVQGGTLTGIQNRLLEVKKARPDLYEQVRSHAKTYWKVKEQTHAKR